MTIPCRRWSGVNAEKPFSGVFARARLKLYNRFVKIIEGVFMKKATLLCVCFCLAVFGNFAIASAQNAVKEPVEAAQNAGQMPVDKLSVEHVESPTITGSAGKTEASDPVPETTWETIVYGEDWQKEREKIGLCIPEFASGLAIPATEADKNNKNTLPVEVAQNITLAIENYYLLLDKISLGAAGRPFEITAARITEGYILLWIDEPGIMDGGRALVYSIEKGKIVADFSDGGIRG